jgi:hypothetical protein
MDATSAGQPQIRPADASPPNSDRAALPAQSREDTDAEWGESPDLGDTERLTRERPPHWE